MRNRWDAIGFGAFVTLAAACASKVDSSHSDQSDTTQVTPQTGATLAVGDQARVQVNAGSVTENKSLQVAAVDADDLAAPVPEVATQPFAFTPHRTTFEKPVTVTMRAATNANAVLRLDDENDTTWEVVDGVTFANGTATFQTNHFCIYITAHINQPQPGTGGAGSAGGASAASGGASALGVGGSSVSAGGTLSAPYSTATGGALVATGGRTFATGGAATGGAFIATGGKPPATGGSSAGTGGASVATGGRLTSGGGSIATGGSKPSGGSYAFGGSLAASGGSSATTSGGSIATGGSTLVTGGASPTTGGSSGRVVIDFCTASDAAPSACYTNGMASCATSISACCADSGCAFALKCTLANTYSESACISDAGASSRTLYNAVKQCLVNSSSGCPFPPVTTA